MRRDYSREAIGTITRKQSFQNPIVKIAKPENLSQAQDFKNALIKAKESCSPNKKWRVDDTHTAAENEYDRFWELNPSDHMLDDKEYEELRQLAQKAIDIYDSLPD